MQSQSQATSLTKNDVAQVKQPSVMVCRSYQPLGYDYPTSTYLSGADGSDGYSIQPKLSYIPLDYTFEPNVDYANGIYLSYQNSQIPQNYQDDEDYQDYQDYQEFLKWRATNSKKKNSDA